MTPAGTHLPGIKSKEKYERYFSLPPAQPLQCCGGLEKLLVSMEGRQIPCIGEMGHILLLDLQSSTTICNGQ